MAERNSFSFFGSYWEAIAELPEREQYAVLKAIIKYALYDEEPEDFKGIKRAVFLLVRPTLDKSKTKAANGKQGGGKTRTNRKQNESKTKANEKQTLSDISEGKGEGLGLGNGEGEGEKVPLAEGSLFTFFWNAYPESARSGREEAWEAWKRLNPTPDMAAKIMEFLSFWKVSKRWTDDDGAFIPAPKNFLNPERSYLRTIPAPAKNEIPKGASGELGEAELEAIKKVLEDDV